jgi:hypothetical protein
MVVVDVHGRAVATDRTNTALRRDQVNKRLLRQPVLAQESLRAFEL